MTSIQPDFFAFSKNISLFLYEEVLVYKVTNLLIKSSMENRISEIKETVERLTALLERELLSQREEIEGLKRSIAELSEKVEKGAVKGYHPIEERETTPPLQDEPLIELYPEPVEEIVPEPLPEPIPEPLPEPQKQVEITLDDEPFFIVKETKSTIKEKAVLGDLFESGKSIFSEYNEKKDPDWMTDIPGPAVDIIEKAMPLNDRFLFIRELFSDDEEQFDLTMERVNEYNSLNEIVNYLRAAFPHWDEKSEMVYRFYMIIRRKCRD